MKVVTLSEAIASGKPFRIVTPPSTGHLAMTGHAWRLFAYAEPSHVGLPPKNDPTCVIIRPEHLKCTECGEVTCGLCSDQVDAWVLWQDDEELDKEAEKIVSGLGLKIKEPAL